MSPDKNSPVRMRQVADLAGVSQSTISRALNDHPDVSEATKERVRAAVKELGYVPDLLARGLRSGSTNTIGVVLRDISVSLFGDIVRGADSELRAHGYSLLLTQSDGDAHNDARNIGLLVQRRVDGMLLSLSSENDEELVSVLDEVGVPCVLLDRTIPGSRNSAVLFDHEDGMMRALAHLAESGYSSVALVAGPPAVRPTVERERGFRLGTIANSLSTTEDWIRCDASDGDETIGLIDSWLGSSDSRPDAIIVGGGRLAASALKAIDKADLVVGRDIGLVVCDDHELFPYIQGGITTIARDAVTTGRRAASILLDAVQEPDSNPVRLAIPTTLIKRSSTLRFQNSEAG